ncbi:MAG: hypothetical protein OXE85_08635, partial [Roseovarius sp.]|nr:hypothetical protein [Roseovarius sp.]
MTALMATARLIRSAVPWAIFSTSQPLLRMWCPGKRGGEPPCWMLPASGGEAGPDTARTALRWYELRWKIERSLHALKVGTRIGDRRLDDADAPRGRLAFDAITAFRVRDLSLPAREKPERLAGRHVSMEDVKALQVPAAHRSTRVSRPPPETAIADFAALAGGLAGSHPSRRRPLPGTEKLWRGIVLPSNAVIGMRALNQWNQKGMNPKREIPKNDISV